MTKKVRRVVTGHDASGKAIILSDGDAPNVAVRPGIGIGSTALWKTEETPSDLSRQDDPVTGEVGLVPPAAGSVFRVVEFPPESQQTGASPDQMQQLGAGRGGEGPARHPGMHRTPSIDYAIVMSGEIDMLMDDSEAHLKAGDVVVQLATNHAWANRGDAPCQIAFILIGATPPWT